MRIAVFSDIHANLPALEACLDSIEVQKADAVYCLGDLVGYNCWPNEVIQEIRRRRIPAIAGNYDYGIGRNIDECGCAYKTEKDREMGKISISYTNSIVDAQQRAYLRMLPAHLRLEYQIQDEKMNLLMVHGSPRKINEYLFEDREDQSFLRMMQQADAHIMCFGHTHKPFHRVIPNNGSFLHAINTGSVGKPKDGDPRGCYVIIELSENSLLTDPASIKVEFIRFNYDIEKAAKAIEGSPLPDEYAAMLRQGV